MIQLQNYISNCLKYYYVSDAERNKMDHKYKPKKLFPEDIIIVCGQKMKEN